MLNLFLILNFLFLVPSQPLNLTVGAVTDTTMELSWLKPKSSDAEKTLDYYIYYHRNNNTECKKYSASSYDVNFSLTDLGMYSVTPQIQTIGAGACSEFGLFGCAENNFKIQYICSITTYNC